MGSIHRNWENICLLLPGLYVIAETSSTSLTDLRLSSSLILPLLRSLWWISIYDCSIKIEAKMQLWQVQEISQNLIALFFLFVCLYAFNKADTWHGEGVKISYCTPSCQQMCCIHFQHEITAAAGDYFKKTIKEQVYSSWKILWKLWRELLKLWESKLWWCHQVISV